MLKDNLSKSTWGKLEKYPMLKSAVKTFIDDNGYNPELGYLAKLTYYVRTILDEASLDVPEFFGWDEDVAEEFYSWGHNSRYYEVLEPMLANDLEFHIRLIIKHLDGTDGEEFYA